MRDRRTKSDETTIAKSSEGNYRPEHVFALKQNLEIFDSYQQAFPPSCPVLRETLGNLTVAITNKDKQIDMPM